MKKDVFLDRDGVINEVLSSRVKFVNKPSQFFLLEGVGKAISLLNRAHIPTFIVTNQGGVGLGFLKESSLYEVHKKMITELAKCGAHIDDIAYCLHKPKAGCACRKPEAQMLIYLASTHKIDLSQSIMVGDREPDIEAGKKTGCKTILIEAELNNFAQANIVSPHLLAAVPWILEELH